MKSNNKTARTAGAIYLLLAITGVVSLMYVPSKLLVAGDATATANNIIGSALLYKVGIVSGLVCQTLFVVLVVILYKLLKHVDKTHALMMVAFVLVSVPIVFINSVNEFAPLILLSKQDYLSTFSTEQLHSLVMVFRKLYQHGILVAEIFWGLWLFPLGYLVYHSNMFPRVLGVMLMLGCFGYLINVFVAIFIPEYTVITYPGTAIASLAEFSFVFWLLIKGTKEPAINPSVSVA